MLKHFVSSLLVSLCILAGFSAFAPVVWAAEQITSFDSHIIINQDTSLQIKETLRYVTTDYKHGIYRYIPVRYQRQGLNYTAKVRDVSVTDEKGQPIPYERKYEEGNVMLKIGDPDTTFTGVKNYVITYTVENALNEITDPTAQRVIPELYWDITGEGWQVEIAASTAIVTSPHANIIRVVCYSGPFGSDDKKCMGQATTTSTALFEYREPINYGDNMTIAVALDPNNALQFPTPFQKFLKRLRDNLNLVPLFIPGLVMLYWWGRKGRDKAFTSWNVFNHDPTQPQLVVPLWNTRPVPMVYEPIKELTPGEAGALMDESVDNQDVIAEIIDLARQKFIKIERTEKKKLFGKDTDYVLTKLKAETPALSAHQAYLLKHLFATGDTVKLSDLKGSFYSHMEKTKDMINKSLVTKGLFTSHPNYVRGWGYGIAILLIVLTGWWFIALLDQGIYWSIPIYAVSVIAALFLAYMLPAKTAKGTNLAWQARGLQRSIRYGAWREKIKEKHLFFEEVLPFAIALGVVDRLSKDMDKLNVKPPQYLHGGSLHHWNTSTFVNSFSTQASSNLTYNPNSSSSGSGGSSGGGSSGGGGGGGGGGSW